MLLPLPLPVPALQAPAPPQFNYADADSVLLARLDLGQPLDQAPALQGPERAAYAWLRAAAGWKPGQAPNDSFAPGSRERQEADALRALIASPAPAPARLAKLPLSLGGSRLLLWRWMRARRTPMAAPLRGAVEDRLAEPGPEIIRGWALRHALCFALAEGDTARFAQLKETYGAQARETLAGFQTAFAMVGGPSPVFRMWRLPELDYRDQGLGDLGSTRVWIAPLEAPPPPGAAWIIPSATGIMGEREGDLPAPMLAEAKELAAKLKASGRQAYYAASAREWERQGLAYFPILIELDAQKQITAIRMGDAAPAKP